MKIFKKMSKFIQQNVMVYVLHKGKYIKWLSLDLAFKVEEEGQLCPTAIE